MAAVSAYIIPARGLKHSKDIVEFVRLKFTFELPSVEAQGLAPLPYVASVRKS
jgi:hypothetical protein